MNEFLGALLITLYLITLFIRSDAFKNTDQDTYNLQKVFLIPISLYVWCLICSFIHRISFIIYYHSLESHVSQMSDIPFGLIIGCSILLFFLIFGQFLNPTIYNFPVLGKKITFSPNQSLVLQSNFLHIPFSIGLSIVTYMFLDYTPALITPEGFKAFLSVILLNTILFLVLAVLVYFIVTLHFHLFKHRQVKSVPLP